jgi:hypothetical protein
MKKILAERISSWLMASVGDINSYCTSIRFERDRSRWFGVAPFELLLSEHRQRGKTQSSSTSP